MCSHCCATFRWGSEGSRTRACECRDDPVTCYQPQFLGEVYWAAIQNAFCQSGECPKPHVQQWAFRMAFHDSWNCLLGQFPQQCKYITYYILKEKYIFQFKQFYPTVVSPKIEQPSTHVYSHTKSRDSSGR